MVNQLSMMSAIIPFKLTDDRRTTITPSYIAIVGRRLGKWMDIDDGCVLIVLSLEVINLDVKNLLGTFLL